MQISFEQAKALWKHIIIKFVYVDGSYADVEIAATHPQFCQMHSTSGKVYDIEFADGTFTCTEAAR